MKTAIIRPPGSNFAQGLTTVQLGVPNYDQSLRQHTAYCEALKQCGLAVTALPPDPLHPDSTFVEDTAILTARAAILTRPGAPSRRWEVAAMRETIHRFYPVILEIKAPGTLDGGDICQAEDYFFLGLSLRTNEEGLRQLASHLTTLGYTSSVIDVRGATGILHLKSGVTYIGGNTLVVTEAMAGHPLFRTYQRIVVPPEETYAANCVRINERVFVAAGYPRLTAELVSRGFLPLLLEVSEFQKMDGGLTCLSLRF